MRAAADVRVGIKLQFDTIWFGYTIRHTCANSQQRIGG